MHRNVLGQVGVTQRLTQQFSQHWLVPHQLWFPDSPAHHRVVPIFLFRHLHFLPLGDEIEEPALLLWMAAVLTSMGLSEFPLQLSHGQQVIHTCSFLPECVQQTLHDHCALNIFCWIIWPGPTLWKMIVYISPSLGHHKGMLEISCTEAQSHFPSHIRCTLLSVAAHLWNEEKQRYPGSRAPALEQPDSIL